MRWMVLWGVACKTGAPTEVVDCGSLALADCAAVEGCSLIEGQPLFDHPDAGACWDVQVPFEALACAPSDVCDDVITFATETLDAPAYAFRNSCVPAGWSTLDAFPGECECASITVAACGANAACQARAGWLLGTDATGWCFDPSAEAQPVFCGPASDCGDVTLNLTQPSTGVGYLFPSDCTPPGWDPLASRYPECGS